MKRRVRELSLTLLLVGETGGLRGAELPLN